MTLRGALVVTILSTSACTDRDTVGGGFSVVDSAGVEIATHWRNEVSARSSGIGLCPTPSVEIGSLGDDATALHRVTDLARIQGRGIAVANSGSGEVKLFDSSGRFSHSLGRLGGGPGEFGRLTKIGVSPDGNVLAYDGQAGRVTEFDWDSGSVIATTSLAVDEGTYELAGLRRARAIGWFNDGRFWGYIDVRVGDRLPPSGDGWVRHEWVSNLHVFENGTASDVVAAMPGTQDWVMGTDLGGGRVRFEGVHNPFLPTFEAATDGEFVAYGSTGRFDISLIERRLGRVVRIVRRADGTRLVSAAHRETWINAIWGRGDGDGTGLSARRRSLYESVPVPDTMPAFETFLLQPRGRLWVKETSFDNPTSPTRQWSVFDGQGTPLGIVDIPTDLQVFEIGRDHVFGVWTDDLGVQYVRMYDLVAGGSSTGC